MLLIAMLTQPTTAPDGAPIPATRPLTDVVVPVQNEQGSLEPSIRRLHRFRDNHLPFAWRIVIADNVSTDATPGIAASLALELPHTEVLRLTAKGRGRALRAAQTLLPEIEDDAWFFDTELLVLAQRRGLRIHEVAVDWVDDPDSSVEILPTALADLRGVARLLARTSFARSALIGAASTLAYALLYLPLRSALAPVWANAIGLAITAVMNTQANRTLTFGMRGADGLVAQQAAGLAAFGLALALTDGALATLAALDPGASRALETSLLVVASAAGTVGRFLALRLVLSRGEAAAPRRPSSLRFARRAARDRLRPRTYAHGRPASPARPCPGPPEPR